MTGAGAAIDAGGVRGRGGAGAVVRAAPGRPARWRSADQVAVPAPGPPLASREVRYLRARIQTELGWSPWSDALRDRGGTARARRLGRPSDHAARRRRGRSRQAPPPLLRRSFTLDASPASARLYVTALGLHRVTLNGRPGLRRPAGARLDRLPPPPAGGHLRRHRPAAPGRERDRRRASATAGIAGGSATSPAATGATYGREVALIAQLEVRRADGSTTVVATDETGGRPPARSDRPTCTTGASIDLRERRPGWDAPGFDAAGWAPARVLEVERPAHRAAPGAARCGSSASCRPRRLDRGPGRTMLDGGQNIAGYVRLTVSRVARGPSSRSGTPRCWSRTGRSTCARCGAPRRPTRTCSRTTP